MRFVKKCKGIFVPLQEKTLSEVKIFPEETVISYTDDGEFYGVCGCVYATQVDLNKQVEFNKE